MTSRSSLFLYANAEVTELRRYVLHNFESVSLCIRTSTPAVSRDSSCSVFKLSEVTMIGSPGRSWRKAQTKDVFSCSSVKGLSTRKSTFSDRRISSASAVVRAPWQEKPRSLKALTTNIRCLLLMSKTSPSRFIGSNPLKLWRLQM